MDTWIHLKLFKFAEGLGWLTMRLEVISPKFLSYVTMASKDTCSIEETSSDEDRRGALEAQLSELKSELSNIQLKIEIEKTRQAIDVHSKHLEDLKNKTVSGTINVGDKIAFHAQLNNHVRNVSPKTVLKFENVTTNIGNCYNASTGVFTAPKDGVYQFIWNYLTDRGGTAYLPLMVNGNLKQWSCIGQSGNQYDSGSGFYLTTLKSGDRVWIEHTYTPTTFLHSGQVAFHVTISTHINNVPPKQF
ncbi:hypothetical protein KUTeg_014963 [Tegillarca granosa]|uniref:C1q domain-containing protein n=1 Tax=Tegillarca granosa TaxID=220873 RepID=A0ABQ9ENT3_TEGGR|nr:hypothetical protein KUTeg_014963 [Tegillarca granosa]